jgi:hypothetical protein
MGRKSSFSWRSLFTIHRHYHLDVKSIESPLNRLADAFEQFNMETFGVKSPEIAARIEEEAKIMNPAHSGPFSSLLRGDSKETDDETDILYTDHDKIALDEELERRGIKIPEEETK